MSEVRVEKLDEAVVVHVSGSLTGGDLTDALEDTIDKVLGGMCPRLILDFAQVDHLNSIGMAAVIRAHAASRKGGTRFFVVNAQERIRAVFEITRITTLGILRDTIEEALGD